MKAKISVNSLEDLKDEAKYAIEIYEEPPEGADPEDDDDPHLGEDGTLILETDELEVEAAFPLAEFPQKLSFSVSYIGWDETEERMAEARGLETHPPAYVTIQLKKKWRSKTEKSMAVYSVDLS